MIAVEHKTPFFVFVSGQWRMSLFLCVTTGRPPPPLSTPALSAVLQSAKLLSVSLERHMLPLSSRYLPWWHPLTLSRIHTHACVQTLGLYFNWHGFVMRKNWRDLYCAGVSGGGPVVAFTWMFTLDENYTPTQAQICIRPRMNAFGNTETQMLLSSL